MRAASRVKPANGKSRSTFRRTAKDPGLWIPDDGTDPAPVLEHQGVRLDRVRHRVYCNDREVHVTPVEFRLLECLLGQPDEVWTRIQLMEAALPKGHVSYLRTIDQHIAGLRRHLGNAGLIETVWGKGYRLRQGGPDALPSGP